MSMTKDQAVAMELMARHHGGHPWNWAPLPEWEVKPHIWYNWADPKTGRVGECLRRLTDWAQPPTGEEPVVFRHHKRPRARDQIGYLLRKMLPGWDIMVGADRHDFVELWLGGDRVGDPLVLIQGRTVAFCIRDSADPKNPQPYQVIEEVGPYKGRGWTDRLILDVYRRIGMVEMPAES